LEDGLTEPIPTEAEILFNSFKSPDASRSFSPKFKATQAPAPLSIPDVLHELKRMQGDWMAEIGFVKKLRNDFELLREEMLMHRSMAEKAQQSFYMRFEKTAMTASEQHDHFMREIQHRIGRSISEAREGYEALRHEVRARLDEIQHRQMHLIEMVESLRKDQLGGLNSPAPSIQPTPDTNPSENTNTGAIE
jgi:hypothetical protein